MIRRVVSLIILLTFSVTTVVPPAYSQGILSLPRPGTMISISPVFTPPILKGIKIFPDNPLKFDFILDTGHSQLQDAGLKDESAKLIKYFLASLTVPDNDLWVNLSPYEKDRIIPDQFGVTEMGRDLLAQDYILKQLTASLIYPEKDLGKSFWDKVHKKVNDLYGKTDIPVDTFNKVWVVPDKAVVYENGDIAYIAQSHLKVMLEEDYLARSSELGVGSELRTTNYELTQIIREVIVPEIEKEVNQGKNFSALRQIYHSMILATWFKRNLKESVLGKVYVGGNKVSGVDIEDKEAKQKIYEQYLEAFKLGVYNYIKEEYDPTTQEVVPKKYFSGGMQFGGEAVDRAVLAQARSAEDIIQTAQAGQVGSLRTVSAALNPIEKGKSPDAAMLAEVYAKINGESREIDYQSPVELLLAGHSLVIVKITDIKDPELKSRFSEDVGFVILNPNNTGEYKGLRDGETVLLGRQIPFFDRFSFLQDQRISRRHLEISRKGNTIKVTDLVSAVGTEVWYKTPVDEQVVERNIKQLPVQPGSFQAEIDPANGEILQVKAGGETVAGENWLALEIKEGGTVDLPDMFKRGIHPNLSATVSGHNERILIEQARKKFGPEQPTDQPTDAAMLTTVTIDGRKIFPLIAPTAITHEDENCSDGTCIITLSPEVSRDMTIQSKSQVFIFLPGDIRTLRKHFSLSAAEQMLKAARFNEKSGYGKLGKEGSLDTLPEQTHIPYVKLTHEELIRLNETREFMITVNTSRAQSVEDAIIMASLGARFVETPYIKLEIRDQDLWVKNDETLAAIDRLIALNPNLKILPMIGRKISREMVEKLLKLKQIVALRIEATQPGSRKGFGEESDKQQVETLVAWIREIRPDLPLIAEGGIGTPGHVTEALKMGFDAVLVNAAITQAEDPVAASRDFANAVINGPDAAMLVKNSIRLPQDRSSALLFRKRYEILLNDRPVNILPANGYVSVSIPEMKWDQEIRDGASQIALSDDGYLHVEFAVKDGKLLIKNLSPDTLTMNNIPDFTDNLSGQGENILKPFTLEEAEKVVQNFMQSEASAEFIREILARGISKDEAVRTLNFLVIERSLKEWEIDLSYEDPKKLAQTVDAHVEDLKWLEETQKLLSNSDSAMLAVKDIEEQGVNGIKFTIVPGASAEGQRRAPVGSYEVSVNGTLTQAVIKRNINEGRYMRLIFEANSAGSVDFAIQFGQEATKLETTTRIKVRDDLSHTFSERLENGQLVTRTFRSLVEEVLDVLNRIDHQNTAIKGAVQLLTPELSRKLPPAAVSSSQRRPPGRQEASRVEDKGVRGAQRDLFEQEKAPADQAMLVPTSEKLKTYATGLYTLLDAEVQTMKASAEKLRSGDPAGTGEIKRSVQNILDVLRNPKDSDEMVGRLRKTLSGYITTSAGEGIGNQWDLPNHLAAMVMLSDSEKPGEDLPLLLQQIKKVEFVSSFLKKLASLEQIPILSRKGIGSQAEQIIDPRLGEPDAAMLAHPFDEWKQHVHPNVMSKFPPLSETEQSIRRGKDLLREGKTDEAHALFVALEKDAKDAAAQGRITFLKDLSVSEEGLDRIKQLSYEPIAMDLIDLILEDNLGEVFEVIHIYTHPVKFTADEFNLMVEFLLSLLKYHQEKGGTRDSAYHDLWSNLTMFLLAEGYAKDQSIGERAEMYYKSIASAASEPGPGPSPVNDRQREVAAPLVKELIMAIAALQGLTEKTQIKAHFSQLTQSINERYVQDFIGAGAGFGANFMDMMNITLKILQNEKFDAGERLVLAAVLVEVIPRDDWQDNQRYFPLKKIIQRYLELEAAARGMKLSQFVEQVQKFSSIVLDQDISSSMGEYVHLFRRSGSWDGGADAAMLGDTLSPREVHKKYLPALKRVSLKAALQVLDDQGYGFTADGFRERLKRQGLTVEGATIEQAVETSDDLFAEIPNLLFAAFVVEAKALGLDIPKIKRPTTGDFLRFKSFEEAFRFMVFEPHAEFFDSVRIINEGSYERISRLGNDFLRRYFNSSLFYSLGFEKGVQVLFDLYETGLDEEVFFSGLTGIVDIHFNVMAGDQFMDIIKMAQGQRILLKLIHERLNINFSEEALADLDKSRSRAEYFDALKGKAAQSDKILFLINILSENWISDQDGTKLFDRVLSALSSFSSWRSPGSQEQDSRELEGVFGVQEHILLGLINAIAARGDASSLKRALYQIKSQDPSVIPNSEDKAREYSFRIEEALAGLQDSDAAMLGKSEAPGGIDLNPNKLDLQTQGQGIDFQIPANLQYLQAIPLDGFTPIIIQIVPANLPLLMGMAEEPQPKRQVSRL